MPYESVCGPVVVVAEAVVVVVMTISSSMLMRCPFGEPDLAGLSVGGRDNGLCLTADFKACY